MAGEGEANRITVDARYFSFVRQLFMNQHDYCRRRIAAVCSLLGIASVQFFSTSRAEASCGDWLAHAGDLPAVHGRDVESRQHKGDGSAATKGVRSSDVPLSRPCHGPFCRSAPSQPAPTAPATLYSQFEKLALFGSAGLILTDCRQLHFGDETSAHPLRGYPVLIDHPPRS